MGKTPQDIIAAGIGNWLAGYGDEYSYHEPHANWRTLLDQQEGDAHDVAEYVLQGLARNGYAIVELPEGQEWAESQTDFVHARTDPRCPNEIAHFLCGPGKWVSAGKAREIAAALLAAANAAES